jgi:hypothetical protein
MPKARERDGVFQRKDRSGWYVSYVDAAIKTKVEKSGWWITAEERQLNEV